MSSLSTRIVGTFGCSDHNFALHAADEQRAFDLLTVCREDGIRLSEVKAEAELYLQSKTQDKRKIQSQLDELDRMYGPWLEP